MISELVGANIDSIWVNSDQSQLVLVENAVAHVLTAEGDCCSHSWFEEVIGIPNITRQGSVIMDVFEIPLKTPAGLDADEEVFYGIAIRTNQGNATIVYRNSSNGYYGGTCLYSRQTVTEIALRTTKGEWKQLDDTYEWSAS